MALAAETVETKANYLLPGSMTRNRVPVWPPDVFCLCAAILQSSGAYSRVIDDVGSKSKNETSKPASESPKESRPGVEEVICLRNSPKDYF